MRPCCMLQMFNASPLAPFAHYRFLHAKNNFQQPYREPKNASSAARQNAYSHLTQVLEPFGYLEIRLPPFLPFGFPLTCQSSSDLVYEPYAKAEVFASRFTFNSTLPHFPISRASSSPTVSLFLRCISTMNISRTFRSLGVSKPLGPDGIPPIDPKICAPDLAPLLLITLSSPQAFCFPNLLQIRRDFSYF